MGLFVPVVTETQTHRQCSCWIQWAKFILGKMPQRNGLDLVISLTLCVPLHVHALTTKQAKAWSQNAGYLIWKENKSVLDLFQKVKVFHSIRPLPCLNISLLLNCPDITWLSPSSNQKWGQLTWQKRNKKEGGKEKKKRQRGDPTSLQVCALPPGMPALHPTALQWPHPSPVGPNLPAACLPSRKNSQTFAASSSTCTLKRPN